MPTPALTAPPAPSAPPRWRLGLPALSIRSTVMLAIVAGVVLPALALLGADQHLARRSQEPLVQRTRAAVMATAAAAITEPAWSLDQDAIRRTMDRVLQEPAVCSVTVLDLQPPDGPALAPPPSVGRCPDDGRAVALEAMVMHEGQTVARLRLGFDGTEVDTLLADRQRLMASLVTLQALLGGVVLAVVLSLRLLRPIDRLKVQAGQLAAREPMPPHDWPRGDELGELGQHLNTVHRQVRDLIAELEGKNEQLHRMAMFDHLTGLPNRTLLRELFAREAALARRTGMTLALMFIDLDHFKSVNDRFGHAAGDELLAETARRIRGTLRESDLLCRVSGDEFLALLACADGSPRIGAIADRLVAAVQQPATLASATEPVRVGASVGIALFPRDGADFDALVRAADVAMYRSKQTGRARSCFFHADMDAALRERMDLERELAEALECDQLRLHYQPVVDERDGCIVAVEALVRWQHPRRGLIGPDLFIPVAESTGLVKPLGRWVLATACAQVAAWHARGMGRLQMSVNVSALQLREPEFVAEVGELCARFGLRAGTLALELTESTLLDDGEGVLRAVVALRETGVMLAVDDFGTGYSSLAALKLVRPDRLKIDRSFVHDLPHSRDDAALVQAMFGMASALGIGVVCEGVETEAQRQWLAAHGGHLQQGWLWARALPAAEVEALLSVPA